MSPHRSDDDTATEGDADESLVNGEQRYSIYECIECENIVLSIGQEGSEITCHGDRMREVTDWEIEINSPEIRQVLLDTFGLPKAGIDICLCVIDEGPLAPREVAEALDYDRSTVSEYLRDLVEIGLLERTQLNREEGGYVNVYHSIDLDAMRRETLIGFYAWAGQAASLIEEANVTKQEYMDAEASEALQEVFWEEFRDT